MLKTEKILKHLNTSVLTTHCKITNYVSMIPLSIKFCLISGEKQKTPKIYITHFLINNVQTKYYIDKIFHRIVMEIQIRLLYKAFNKYINY